jgi:hypothetical protein
LGDGLFNDAFAGFLTAFLIRAFFTAFLFAVEILRCFNLEAIWPDAVLPDAVLPDAALPDAVLPDAVLLDAGFFFNSFFFFETSFELAMVAATLFFVLPFCRLESVSLITISFY